MQGSLFSLACLLATAAAAPFADPNIIALASSVPDLSTLVTAIKAAGLVDTLSSKGPFTVFAPTNEAFDKLPKGELKALLADKALLTKVLTYHVASGAVPASALKNDEKIPTVEGADVTIFLPGRGRVVIEGGEPRNFAEVIKADVRASNGIVHIIDHVLLPPRSPGPGPGPKANNTIVDIAAADRDLSTLVTAVTAAGLVDTLSSAGPFTVLAPTNRAFEKLPHGVLDYLLRPEHKKELVEVLTYHVAAAAVQAKQLHKYERITTVEGANVTVVETYPSVIFEGGERGNYARVEKADVEASNGVVHIIDEVLLPPRGLSLAHFKTAKELNIVELAQSVPELSTLVAGVVAAGLAETLSGPGPFTVLAPNNDGFNRLPAGELARLLQPANRAELVDILTYHVASGTVLSSDLSDGQRITTVQGSAVTARVFQGEVFFEGGQGSFAVVQAADNRASNGVVHIIDNVLLPPVAPTMNIVELAQSVPALSTLVAAVVAGGLVETLSGPGPFTVFAPTNTAFERLPAGTLEFLLQPENRGELVAILTYHVASGAVRSSDLSLGQSIPTVEGASVTVEALTPLVVIRGGSASNLAPVSTANVEATNGVVHIVEGVLLPPSGYSWSKYTNANYATAASL